MITEVNSSQALSACRAEIPNSETPSPTGVRNENITFKHIGPCNPSMDHNFSQLPVNMNATFNRNFHTPTRPVCNGGNGNDNPENYLMVEYSGKRKPESEKELCDTINKIKTNFTRETRKKGVAVRYKIGQEIWQYYKGEYGQNEMKRIAKNTGISSSALYKYVQLAKRFSETQFSRFMDIEYISYRLVIACLSIDNEAEIRQVFMSSTSAKEAGDKINKLKKKGSAKDIKSDDGSASIDPDNKTAQENMDNSDLAHKNTDKETSRDSNVAVIADEKGQLPQGSESSAQQTPEKIFEIEQNKGQQDGQSSQANEPVTNVNESHAEESKVTNGENDKPTTENQTPSEDTDGNQQKETQDGEAQSPAEQKNPEQLSAAPQQEQEEAGVGSDCQKNQDFSNDDNENNFDSCAAAAADEEAADEKADSGAADADDSGAEEADSDDAAEEEEESAAEKTDADEADAEKADSCAENAQEKAIDKDVKDITSGSFSLSTLQLNHNLGGAQDSFRTIYEKTGIIGNVLIKVSQEMPDHENLKNVYLTAIAELSALLSHVSESNTSNLGTTLSGGSEWASSCQYAAAQA